MTEPNKEFSLAGHCMDHSVLVLVVFDVNVIEELKQDKGDDEAGHRCNQQGCCKGNIVGTGQIEELAHGVFSAIRINWGDTRLGGVSPFPEPRSMPGSQQANYRRLIRWLAI